MWPFKKKKLSFSLPSFLKTPVLLSYLIAFCISLFSLVLYPRIQPQIPLFYSLAEPQAQLVSKEWLLLLPGIALAIVLVHTLILQLTRFYHKILLQLFAWMTVIVLCVVAANFIRLILIIT